MPSINLNDLNNAKADVEHIAAVATSPAPTATDRLGRIKLTLQGVMTNIGLAADTVMAGLGYSPPVTYASGLSMTLRSQTVQYAGNTYAPKSENLPFVTSGTFETAKFRLIQGVTGADLAASLGSALMGFIQDGVGAVVTTVLKKLRLMPPDVEDYGAVGDGVADDWAAITKALDAMAARGGNVTLRMSKRYRITKGLKIPSYVCIEGTLPSRYAFNNGGSAPAIVGDLTDPNQWLIEPRTTRAGATIAYNVMLTEAPDGFTFNVGVRNLVITSIGVTPYGGIRMHGCPGAVVEGVSILNTGIGLLINESFGANYQVHTQTLYYGVIAWCDVNACTIDAYCTQAVPKPRTVPDAYLFSGIKTLNGNFVSTLGLSTDSHYNRPFGMVFGAQVNATASNNEIGFTCEYFPGGLFAYNARSAFFKRLYVEGGASEVAFGIVSASSTISSVATHAYFSGSGSLLDIGNNTSVDINLNGVISYATFKSVGVVPNTSKLTVRGAKAAGAGLVRPEINVSFPDDGGDWIIPTLLNGWTNAGGVNAAVAYRLNPYSKEVENKGVPIGGVEGQPAYILPAGYRSLNRGSYPVVITSAASPIGTVTVLATGEVIPSTAGMSANGLDLKPVRFRAEQ